MLHRFVLILVSCLAFVSARATHNRAGEITYKRIPPFTKVSGGITVQNYRYLITVTKYTDDGPGIADRCVDTVYFGDNTSGIAPRINGASGCGCGSVNNVAVGCGEMIIEDGKYRVKKNIYTIEHTYAGAGSFLIRSFDPNRNQGVRNIPNSVNLPFYIESLLIINSFSGANSSPIFAFPPIDRACVGECFKHNPGAYDPDKDDSLSFHISTSRQADGQTVAGYSYPDTQPGGFYGIDARTGLLSWCNPVYQDEYNLAFIVKEWRKNTSGIYELIGYVLRDMQVIVGDCAGNHPPDLVVPADTCVEAGTLIEKNIFVSDPDDGDQVTIQGGSGAFTGAQPWATLTNTIATTSTLPPGGFYAHFRWQTTCEHVRKQEYQSTFKVMDNGIPNKLVTFKTYNIKVVPPAVKNVTAVPIGTTIKVSWAASSCSPTNNPISSYKIYRRNDCTTFTPEPCKTGVSATSGFSLIGSVPSGTLSFTDDNKGVGLVVGQNYSYMVVAVYYDGTEAYGSSAVCSELKRDIPVLLNVDVLSTSKDTGSVLVKWTLPLTTPGNFDPSTYPGPYKFNLKHRAGSTGNFVTVFTSENADLNKLDLLYYHRNLNTSEIAHHYIIEFISGSTVIGNSQLATSVFVKLQPSDRRITLQWQSNTPWNNYKYDVWRREPGGTQFTKIGSTAEASYTDTLHIANRYSYCYYVESEGQYSDPSIYKPLINKSQQVCATAVDLTPPCTPTLQVEADCPTGFVKVYWNNVRNICSDDVTGYVLSYKPTVNDEYTVYKPDTATMFVPDGLTYISGCYAIQAMDSSGNLSPRSPDFCIDNCPIFELPNIFSPNGDGNNDHFMAIRVRQIREIYLNVFDRWGNLVYTTTDPYFKWDSKSIITGKDVSEGVFFYTCDVFEPRLKGIVKRTLKGSVHLVR